MKGTLIKNKIYDLAKEYISDYLFGFNKSQLEASLLKGNLTLKNINFRPDKVNALVEKMQLPISIKAGMIGSLELRFSLISWWNSPLRVAVDDLLFIVGPSLQDVSNPESFEEDSPHAPYSEDNMLSIFDGQLRLSKRPKDFARIEEALRRQEALLEKMAKDVEERIKTFGSLELDVKRIHIRYEDDFFAAGAPYAFGLTIERIALGPSEGRWSFSPGLQSCLKPSNAKSRSDREVLAMKNIALQGLEVYWNSLSEMFIPTSLWESTKHLEFQIFDAMPTEALQELMLAAFGEQRNASHFCVLHKTDVMLQLVFEQAAGKEGAPRFCFSGDALFENIRAEVRPSMAHDLRSLIDYYSFFPLALDTK